MGNITINARSSIRIEGTKIIYFDPFKISDERHDADIIFITHEHFDHFSPEDIMKISNKQSILIAPESMKELVCEKVSSLVKDLIFVSPENPRENHIVDTILVKCVPAYNVDKPFHLKESNWVGYVVTMDGETYFIAGDTDENIDNNQVECDVFLVPCGGKYTCDVMQAAAFTQKIGPRKAIPTHYTDIAGDSEIAIRFKQEVLKLVPDMEVDILI